MFERFGADARAAVVAASSTAAELRGDGYLGTEHLLIGVLWEHGPIGDLDATRCRDALDALDREALRSVGLDVEPARPSSTARRTHRRFTSGAKDCLHRSLRIAIARGDRRITAYHLLASLAGSGERDTAVRIIRSLDIDPAAVQAEALGALDSGGQSFSS